MSALLAVSDLSVRLGQRPVLKSVSVNVDAAGRPVEFGRTWFAGDKVVLSFAGDAG